MTAAVVINMVTITLVTQPVTKINKHLQKVWSGQTALVERYMCIAQIKQAPRGSNVHVT